MNDRSADDGRLADLLEVASELRVIGAGHGLTTGAGGGDQRGGVVVAGATVAAGALIESRLPWLVDEIRTDAAAGRFTVWGLSTVVDEITGSAVLDRATFEALHRFAGYGVDAASDREAGIAWPIGNAGLLHVYGYLLSVVETPWGAKRDRWIGGDVARAFRADPLFLTPWYLAGLGMGAAADGAGAGAADRLAGSSASRTLLARVQRLVTGALAAQSVGGAVRFMRDEQLFHDRVGVGVGVGAGAVSAGAGVARGNGDVGAAGVARDVDDGSDDHVDSNDADSARRLIVTEVMRTVVVASDDEHAALVYGRVGFDLAGGVVSVRPVTTFPVSVTGVAFGALAAAESRLRYNAAFVDLAPLTFLPVAH